MHPLGIAALALVLLACPGGPAPAPEAVAFQIEEDARPVVAEMLDLIGDPRLGLGAGAGDAHTLVVVARYDGRCAECYRIEPGSSQWTLRAGGLLGLQYGVADVLERLGYRFLHPYASLVPPALLVPDEVGTGLDVAPERPLRGLHLHTLHPSEALWDFWIPSKDGLARARRVVDWLVKNRGNYLQWVALDDVTSAGPRQDAWRDHTRAILDAAHGRGVECGLGLQLFGSANLQFAYDLVDDDAAPLRPQIEARLEAVTAGLPFDLYSLSFGEFFGSDPQRFIDSIDLAWEVLKAQAPAARLTTFLHVGEDLRVTWEGEEMIYYFLAQFADPAIVPWVHTVMYYNLFDDAGGAYHHENFDAHRAFLLDRLRAGEPVGYVPESGYWIAFDNAIPTYLPIYLRSRFEDLHRIRQIALAEGIADLPEHVLFTTGWEWGYWQQDLATLRLSFQLSEDVAPLMAWTFAPLGPGGGALGEAVAELADVQYAALLEGRLAPWIASRDVLMDYGDGLGIVSQPRRPLYGELVTLAQGERDALRSGVLVPLEALAADTRRIAARVAELDLPGGGRWLREVGDGMEVDSLRAEFAARVLRALLDHADGEDAAAGLAEAGALLEAAREVIFRRHDDLHDPQPRRLLDRGPNPTLYDFGYLHHAEIQCFWERELALARGLVEGVPVEAPGCAL